MHEKTHLLDIVGDVETSECEALKGSSNAKSERGVRKGVPINNIYFILVSMGVEIGLQLSIWALSRISRAYCCWERKTREVLRWTFMARK
jgi:hypothetical protein